MARDDRHSPSLRYRPDIDGLRAVAVVSVVVFHAFPSLLGGGFVGVDIFFVISGFLISSIIFKALSEGTFSFVDFYTRRVKRIFPALLLVLATSLLFGWFVLFASEYKQLGKQTAAGAGFVANLLFWRESGYFDSAAEHKPLLHLWSLGVEEQFYLVWPIMAWIFSRNIYTTTISMLTILLISLYENIHITNMDAITGFYSPITRFWELMTGGLISIAVIRKTSISIAGDAFIQKWNSLKHKRDILSLCGIATLAASVFLIGKNDIFPGKNAIPPVAGAAFLILAGPSAWVNRVVLANGVFVWMGRISFPLYLWHWPILTYVRITKSVDQTTTRAVAVLASLLLAELTYRFVESPVRFGEQSKVRPLILSSIIIFCFGLFLYVGNGLPFRMAEKEAFIGAFDNSFPDWKYFQQTNLPREWRSECAFFDGKKYMAEGALQGGVADSKPVDQIHPSCYVREPSFDKAVLIWGDSHAQALSPGIVAHIPRNWQVLQIASSGCIPSPFIETPSTTSQCNQANYFAMKTIREARPDVVVVAQAGGHAIKLMEDITARLAPMGVKKILFVGPVPRWQADLPKIFARHLWESRPSHTNILLNKDVLFINKYLADNFKGSENAEYVNVIELFCNKSGCLTYTDADIKASMTAWDTGHLTISGSRYLARNLLIDRIIGKE